MVSLEGESTIEPQALHHDKPPSAHNSLVVVRVEIVTGVGSHESHAPRTGFGAVGRGVPAASQCACKRSTEAALASLVARCQASLASIGAFGALAGPR